MKRYLYVVIPLVFVLVIVLLKTQQKPLHNFSNQLVGKESRYDPTPITIDSVFSDDKDWIATLSAEFLTTIVATGDIIPARSVNYQTVTRNNFLWPYEYTHDYTSEADITFINLEAPLLEKCPVTQEGMVFCGDSRHIEGLKYAGVDVASIANNHSANHGNDGILQTEQLLAENDIKLTGTTIVDTPVIDSKGIRFAFVGLNDIPEFTPLIQKDDESLRTMENLIYYAKKKADVVIVALHAGNEYVSQPTSRQRILAHKAIDLGADVVIGNHPHWVQPIEIYKEKFITYAHGNFVFDQMWSEKTKEGVIGKYTFSGTRLIDVEFTPIVIQDFGQPRIATGERRQQILDGMREESVFLLSKPLN